MSDVMGLTNDPRFNPKIAIRQDTPPEGVFDLPTVTPLPDTSKAWLKQQKRPTFTGTGYGIDLCFCAITSLMRSNGGIPPEELWVSDLLIPEIEADAQLIYETIFNGYLPHLYSKRVIKPVRIRVDDSLPRNTIAYTLP